MADTRKPPWPAQREKTLEALHRAIDQICDSWDEAMEAHAARGYGKRSSGLRSAPTKKNPNDPSDPLHTSTSKPVSTKVVSFSDPTGQTVRDGPLGDQAERWLAAARGYLSALLRFTSTEIAGSRKWTGPFYPVGFDARNRRKKDFHAAATELVEWWPRGCGHFIDQIIKLGGIAMTQWPPEVKIGETVETPEGPVTRGARRTVETCTECGTVIGANAEDPLARIDGKPYHRSPCYQTVWQRNRRRVARDDRSVG